MSSGERPCCRRAVAESGLRLRDRRAALGRGRRRAGTPAARPTARRPAAGKATKMSQDGLPALLGGGAHARRRALVGRQANKCRVYSAAQQTTRAPRAPNSAFKRCRNCPKSKPRAAAFSLSSSATASPPRKIYDRRLRWPVPRALEKNLTGRTIDAVDRRSKYLLFRVGARHAARPLRDDGKPAGFHAPSAAHDARSLRHRSRLGSHAPLSGSASVRRTAVAVFACRRASPARIARPRTVRPGVRCAATCGRATRRRKAAIKLALMDNALITGVGNIYANESLFRAGIRPTIPGVPSFATPIRPVDRRRPGNARRRDRQRRVDASQLRRTAAASPAISSSTTSSTDAKGSRAAFAALQ